MADNQTEGAIAIKPLTITAVLVDTTKRDFFRGFGISIGTLGVPSDPWQVLAFGGILELHATNAHGKRYMVEVDLNGAIREMAKMVTDQIEAQG